MIGPLLLCASSLAAASSGALPYSSADIAQSVSSSLPTLMGSSATVGTSLDLTRPFQTVNQWTFVSAILPGTHYWGGDTEHADGGALAQCFVEGLTPHCTYGTPKVDFDWFSTPVELYLAKVVHQGPNDSGPLLMVSTGSALGGDASHGINTQLFAYDVRSNQFQAVFSNITGSNNNQKTTFLEQGPLQGAVVVDKPTSKAPFKCWIEVYRPGDSGRYARVLRCRSQTGYADRNSLTVADSEMPEILRRLGLWKPGDPLPAPSGCNHPTLRHGEEWCE